MTVESYKVVSDADKNLFIEIKNNKPSIHINGRIKINKIIEFTKQSIKKHEELKKFENHLFNEIKEISINKIKKEFERSRYTNGHFLINKVNKQLTKLGLSIDPIEIPELTKINENPITYEGVMALTKVLSMTGPDNSFQHLRKICESQSENTLKEWKVSRSELLQGVNILEEILQKKERFKQNFFSVFLSTESTFEEKTAYLRIFLFCSLNKLDVNKSIIGIESIINKNKHCLDNVENTIKNISPLLENSSRKIITFYFDDIFQFLDKIPNNEKLKIVSLLSSLSKDITSFIIDELKKIPVDELESVILCTICLLKHIEKIDGDTIPPLLRAVAEIPLEEREDCLSKIAPYINLLNENRASFIKIIQSIPTPYRTEETIAAAFENIKYFSGFFLNHPTSDALKAMFAKAFESKDSQPAHEKIHEVLNSYIGMGLGHHYIVRNCGFEKIEIYNNQGNQNKYGQLMHQAILETFQYRKKHQPNLKEALAFCADCRTQIATQMDYSQPSIFGKRRDIGYITPFYMEYQHLADPFVKREATCDLMDEESLLKLGSGKSGYSREEKYLKSINNKHEVKGVVLGNIHNNITPLSYSIIAPYPGTNTMVPTIYHTIVQNIPKVIDYADEIYQQALSAEDPEKIMELCGRLFWWICQAKPWYRGDPSIIEILIRSIFKEKGMQNRPWKAGMIPWGEATLEFDVDAFAKNFHNLFEP